jgi:hypothetical protein
MKILRYAFILLLGLAAFNCSDEPILRDDGDEDDDPIDIPPPPPPNPRTDTVGLDSLNI